MAKYLQRGLGEVYGREVEEYNNRDTIRETLEEMASSPQPEEPPAEETAQEEKLELIPGETLIGVISDGNVSGEYRERIEVYYGNFVLVYPGDGNKFRPLKKEKYNKMLDEFLASQEGEKYRRPSEEEKDAAFQEVKKVVKTYLEKKKADATAENTLQPGRAILAQQVQEKRKKIIEAEKGQSLDPQEEEIQRFKDDIAEEEQKAVEFIQNKNYTRQQIKEIRKGLDSEKRRSTLGTVAIIAVALFILGVAVFLVKDIIVKMHALIELDLKQNEITIRAGDSFIPSDYVKYVTDDESVYVIYPSLDTQDVGSHSLDFVATNGIKNVRKTMIVNVIDGDSPTIVLTDEEIKLVRGRDEETFDALKYVKEVHDNIDADEDLYVEVNPIDWEKDEQSLSYRVKDSSGNAGSAVLLVKIEDKAVCDKNAIYNSATNTCSCKSGYSGDGIACKLIQSSSGSTATSGSGNSSGSGSSGSSGNSGGSSSSSSSSSSESYTIDYEDYQPGNGQYDVAITDNNTGDSTTVTTEDPPMPGASDDEFFDWINDQLP